jgi:predicted metal-binding protein
VSMDSCRLCDDCRGTRVDCVNKKMARPGADAMGIDVFATVRAAGFHIDVLKSYDEAMNRFAFLLVD